MDWINENQTLVYYVVMVVIYSGAGAWLVGRLTRGRADERREARAALADTLALLTRLEDAKPALDPAERTTVERMQARLRDETGRRIGELNALAERERARPAERYLLLPPPRTAAGVVVSLLFAVSAYFSFFSFLGFGLEIYSGELDPLAGGADQTRALGLIGLGVVLLLVALLTRWLAFRAFSAHARGVEAEAATEMAKLRSEA